MLSDVEQVRLTLSKAVDPGKKSQLGQFFTPASIARFMAELFVEITVNDSSVPTNNRPVTHF